MRQIWFDGSIVPWEAAQVHVWDEVALRGASAFEGIRAFWYPRTQQHNLLAYPEHMSRLSHSARLIDCDAAGALATVNTAITELLMAFIGEDVYLRPTIYVERGRSALAANARTSVYVGAFSAPLAPDGDPPLPATAAVSSYRRGGGVISPRAKTGGTYLDFRLIERERIDRGVDHILIPDLNGYVFEADGASLVLFHPGRVQLVVPPTESDSLPSITREILVHIASASGIDVCKRWITRDDLTTHIVGLGGTLLGVRTIATVDGRRTTLPCDTWEELQQRYLELCRSDYSPGYNYLTPSGGLTCGGER